ncbi:hypothetical protein [Kytococcus sedentarius]|uniref:hypothetical protein n=1 Tax=Kytococcus sedentarius TaxID=1276 RepID=UPI00384AAF83
MMGAQAWWDVVVEQVAPVVVSLVVVVVASVLVIRLRFWGYDQEEKMVERATRWGRRRSGEDDPPHGGG